jgi:hypothetical protein
MPWPARRRARCGRRPVLDRRRGPAALPDALLHQVPTCPPELAARLALVRAVESDEGQPLAPGEWLVTRAGHLRRWDGFVARGEGAAEAAALEADNRLADLESRLPTLEATVQAAEAAHLAARDGLAQVQAEWSGWNAPSARLPRPSAAPCARWIRPKPPAPSARPAPPISPARAKRWTSRSPPRRPK